MNTDQVNHSPHDISTTEDAERARFTALAVAHIYGVFTFGALALTGLFVLALYTDNPISALSVVIATFLAWVVQNLHARSPRGVQPALLAALILTTIAFAVDAIARILFSL